MNIGLVRAIRHATLCAAVAVSASEAQGPPGDGQLIGVGAYMGTINLARLYSFSDGSEWRFSRDGADVGGSIGVGISPLFSVIAHAYKTRGFHEVGPEGGEVVNGEMFLTFFDVGFQL